ncbi:MAG: sigma-70 family RNA polymerase sigma factor [Aristaeellaceae bacterium]
MEQAAVPSFVREQRMIQWIDNYSSDIRKICYIYLTDRSQTEDAVQETFLKAWKSMPVYERKGIENDRAWLLRIAINTCRDMYKTGWFRHVDRRQELEIAAANVAYQDPVDHELAIDICRLPEKYKQVILLYYYQDMTLREVAQTLGIPVSTVQRRLKKAEGLLKIEWTGGMDDDR